MPTRIKILSWNLRTYGSTKKTADEYRVIVDTILGSAADIVCIQELMHGHDGNRTIGSAISQKSIRRMKRLADELVRQDPNCTWWYSYTGRNAGRSTGDVRHSADAYGFLWKENPDQSAQNHGVNSSTLIDLPAGIASNPCILRLPTRNFPNRRPGLLQLQVAYTDAAGNAQTLPLNVISFHATTPTNQIWNYKRIRQQGGITKVSRSPGAGKSIQLLVDFNEIGGGHLVPVPNDETVVLGDFNFDIDKAAAEPTDPYDKLRANYQMRIGALGPPITGSKTTYSPISIATNRAVSSYDNVFEKSPTNLTYVGSGVIDFIEAQVGPGQNWNAAHAKYYGRQHGRGVSDHMPVYAEYDVQ